MTLPTVCLLLTSDPQLTQCLFVAAPELTTIRAVDSRSELEYWQERTGVTPVLVDLRHTDSAGVIADAGPETRHLLVAFGLPESAPYLAASQGGLFVVEPLPCTSARWRRIAPQVAVLARLHQERDAWRERVTVAMSPGPAAAPDTSPEAVPLHPFARVTRHVGDPRRLLDQAVDGISDATGIARVGVFARLPEDPVYRLYAGRGCIEGTEQLTFEPRDPLVRWLDRQAHLVCRSRLAQVGSLQDRLLLERALDAVGAEVILPMPGRSGLLGWVLAGHRATGLPFSARDLADLAAMGQYVATLLDNALLYAEVAVQKTLAENLLETIPTGIVAVSEDGTVRWFNRAAEAILQLAAADTVGHPAEQTGSRPADLLRRALAGATPAEPVVWTDAATRRTLQASTRRVGADGTRLGAMLLLADVTRERLLREKQEEVERHAFWNDLAAALSHEIRNPLVAISTFAQLLPERYTDEEFRNQFHDIVTAEVQRLNTIITQINSFAHPSAPAFQAIVPAHLAELAAERAKRLLSGGKLPLEVRIEPDLPRLTADEPSLADGLAHLLANAGEAVASRPDGAVVLHVRRTGALGAGGLALAVRDNGPGIPAEMRDKLFSPFGTTKPRGLGLGLPLARRAAVDHGGRIEVDSTPQGTTVTMLLPLAHEEAAHAETADRR